MVAGHRRIGVPVLAAVVAVLVVGLAPVRAAARAPGCGPTISSPLPDQPWPLRRLRPDLVWAVSTGEHVKVAVIDSGVSVNHPALEGQVLAGDDLVQSGTDGHCDQVGHGT